MTSQLERDIVYRNVAGWFAAFALALLIGFALIPVVMVAIS